MKGFAVGLLHGGLIGYSSASPNISGINTDRVSVNGGYRLTITGSGFQPAVANSDFTLASGVPQVELRNSNSNLADDPTMPCIVVAHFLRDDQIICEVNKPIYSSSILTSSDQWKAKVIVDGETSNNSDVFKHSNTNEYTAAINFFENNNAVAGRQLHTGGWTAWINNDIVDPATSITENETLAGLITEVNGSCTQPLAIQVKNVSTGTVYSDQELIDGFTNCDCTASIFTGLSCAVPAEDAGDFCTSDHAVRYYCANENVVGFAFTNSQAGEFTKQPALYNADGLKFAECETSFVTPDGEVIELINESHRMPNSANTYDFLRCRMAWSTTPTVGNYVFQFAEELGYSASYQNSFMGSDGKLYNMQVHPIISSVSPSTGSTNGGAVITLTGVNLGGVNDIRIGGVPCTDVNPNSEGTEATCISGAQPATCADGDDPVVGTNCANWESSGNLGSGVDFNGGSVYNYDVNGSPCVEGSTCDGNQPACETTMGYNNFCYVPDCSRYIRKYPGSPGMDYQWIDRTYPPNESINTFGMFADGVESGSKVVSSSHTVSTQLENIAAHSHFSALSSGFFKPPKTGYYSMVVSQCDDECLFQISDVQDMGCPSTLRTRGRSDQHRTYDEGNAARAENHDVFYTQDKIFLNSDSQYYINLHHMNGYSNYHANFGYVYHGPDANVNADGAPGFTAGEAENMPELNYVNEVVDLWAKNTDFVEETQEFVNIVTDDTTPFQLLVCPSEDTPDAECARTGDITFSDFDNQSFEQEIINSRGAVCSTTGSIDISNGYYNGYQTNDGASGFLAYHKDSFCGNNKVSGYQPNSEAHIYNMWTGEPINQFNGQGFSVKKATDACFAVKGSPNQVVFYAEKVDDNDVLRGWWFIHDYNFGANAHSWTFVCVDLAAVMLTEMGNQPAWFADPTTHDASDWTLKQMKIRDTTHSNQIYIDEVYIGIKDALFNIQQTSSNVHPGAKAKTIHIESMSNNDHTFTVRMEPTINSCSDGPYTLLRVDVGGTVTKATRLTSQSAGLSGSFDVSYNGNTATIKTALLNEWNKNPIINEITNQFGADFSDISVSLNGDCLEGWEFKIANNLPGDFADMSVDGANLLGVSGANIDARVRQRKNGGVMFRTMTSAHLSRARDTPQVQAWSGDVQAICSSSSACGFTFSDDGLLTLMSITQSNGNGNVVRGDDDFTLNGSGFTDGGQTIHLRNTETGTIYEISEMSVDANGDSILASCTICPAGSYMVSIKNTVGRSIELALTIQEEIVLVECNMGSECSKIYDTGVHVGSALTITGFGFTAASRVKIGTADCVVTSQTLTEIKCVVLPGQTASGLSVTINGSSESANQSIRIYDQYAIDSNTGQVPTDRINTCTLTNSAALSPGQANIVSFTCNWDVSGPFIPTNGIYKVTMINDATGIQYNYDSSAVNAANEQATFTTDALSAGSYTLVFRDSDFSVDGHPADHYAYILYSTSISVETSVSGVTGNSGSQLGGGVLTVSGVNVENIDVTVGGQSCSNMISSGFTCLVPAHTDFVKDMNINANSADSGTFLPATLTISKGTRVNFNWNVFLEDQTIPTFQIKSGDHFTLSTQEGNQGSQFFTFMTPGTFIITTGPYDGINEIIGTVMVQDTSASNTAVIDISKDGQNLFSGTYTYSFADISTYDAVTVSGGSVTVVNGNTNPIFINDGSCSMTADSCDLNTTPGSYNAVVGNMNPISSDSDDVIINRVITSISTVNGFGSVSNLGGGTVQIVGSNLNGVSTVTIAGCNADFTWSGDAIHAIMPVGCAGLVTSAAQVDITADEATATISLTVSADGHGTYTLLQTSSTIQFTVENVSVVSAGSYTPLASFYADGVFTHADCTDTMMIGMSVATATCTFASQPTSNGSFMVGIAGFGYGAEFTNSVFTPRVSALLTSADQALNEGSHYGGLELKVTGTNIATGTTLKYMVNGADLCVSNSCNQAVTDGAMTFTVPASGLTSGDAIAVVKLVGSDGRESSLADEETAKFTHRDSLTPVVSSAVKTANTVRIDLATGMNVDCTLMTATVGGNNCPQVTCSNTRRNGLFISCTLPPLVAGSHTVIVTNPETGTSNSDIMMEQTLVLSSISPSTSGLAGGQYLTISGEGMNPTTATVEILCTGLAAVACPINTTLSTASSVLCTIPTQTSAVTCNIEYESGSTRRRRSTRTSLGSLSFIEQSATLTSVTSSNQASCGVCGGTAGGTVLTITGNGFNNANSPANEVSIDGSPCIVSSATTTEIVCSTSAHNGSNSFDIQVNVVGTGIATGTDIPQFRYVNLWSSPATWGCASGTFEECTTAPNADGHAVEIGPGNEILLDVSTPVLSLLLIREGALVWDINQDNLQLNAEYIVIVGGSFTLGTETVPMTNKATIKLYGHQRSIHLPIYGAKCFAVRSGTVDIHGATVTPTWTFLDTTAEAGTDTINIQTPNGFTGWNIGDRIAIAPTGDETSILQSEDFTIVSITPNGDDTVQTIQLSGQLQFTHSGVESTFGDYILQQRAEVGLLSRNIKFEGNFNDASWLTGITLPECQSQGVEFNLGLDEIQNCFVDRFNDEEGSDKFGAHMLFHNVEYAKVEYMEIHNCGQANELGRYPIHFHNSYDQPNSYLRGLGIWQTYNRAMTLHAVNNALFEKNVAYNNMGHAYFMEDGVEHGNIVRNNLAIKTKIAPSLLSVDQTPAGFWIVNTNNEYYGNHAAGAAGFGFWVNPPLHSTGSNVDNNFCPREIPIKKFENNVAHSCGVYGMWIFEDYNPRKNNWNGECNSQAGLAGADHPMDGFVAWGNFRGVEFSMGSGLHMNNFVGADNTKSNLAVKENHLTDNFEVDSTTFNNAIVIGRSNTPGRTGCTAFGIETPWKHGSFIVNGAKFYNFDDTNNNNCYGIDYCYGSYPFDCGRISVWSGIEWNTSPKKGKFEWKYETVLWDLDGTLSESGTANTKIVPSTPLYSAHCTDITGDNTGWNLGEQAMTCTADAYFHRISIEDIEPESLNSVNLVVNNGNEDRVPWREKRGDDGRAWMYMNMMDTTSDLHFDTFSNHPNITFALKTYYDYAGHYSNLKFGLLNVPDLLTGLAGDIGQMPVLGDINYGYFIDSSNGGDVYIHLEEGDTEVADSLSAFGSVEEMRFEMKKCWYPSCIVPDAGNPTPPDVSEIVTCNWSDTACWPDGVIPGLNEASRANVTIVTDRHVKIDVADLYLDNLFVEGTLELDQSVADTFTISVNSILVNTGYGGVDTFTTTQTLNSAASAADSDGTRSNRLTNENSLPQWQFGRLLIGTESSPIACDKTVTISMTGDDATARAGWGAMDGSVAVGNKTIASFGRLSLVGCGSAQNYITLLNNVAAGSNFIDVEGSVPTDWAVNAQVVVSSSGAAETESEVMTISAVSGNRITFTTNLAFAHAGSADNTVDGVPGAYANAAEVGLLTRNIKIDGTVTSGDSKFGGRVLVASAPMSAIFRQGHATISNVEFVGMGQYGMTSLRDPRFALAFWGIENSSGMTASSGNHANGNAYQPAGYEIGASYVQNCAFHSLYGVAIGANGANNIVISNNVVTGAIDDGIKLGYLTGATIDHNMVAGVMDNVFVGSPPLWTTQTNFDFDGIYMPAGIRTNEEALVTSMKNNAVSGIQGAAYSTWGEACSEDEINTSTSTSTAYADNVGRSSVYGHRILFTQADSTCTRFGGFKLTNMMACGFCSIVGSLHAIVENIEVQDTPVGIYFNDYGVQAVSHVAEDKTRTVKNSLFIGATAPYVARNCNRDYLFNSAGANEGQMMQMWSESSHLNKQFISETKDHNIGYLWPLIQGGMHSYPHKPFDKPTKNMVLYARGFLRNVQFANYGNDCGAENFAISNNPKQHDHQQQIDVNTLTFTNVAEANKLHLHEPKLEWINPSDCVDMDCDGPKKAMILDEDGSLSGTGNPTTFMGVSELDYGVNGPRGLGNWRIPPVMLTNLDGSAIDADTWAPNKGVVGTLSEACTLDSINHYYKCDNSVQYTQVLYESMDVDTETRRVAPIAYMADGTVDIINGVSDQSCCAGYACQLRQTTHPMIMACGKEYELATTGTLNKDIKLHMNRQPNTCKINLKIYTRRQNRQDVYVNGNLVLATNSALDNDGNLSFSVPTASDIPTISDIVGTNFFDRTAQILHVNIQGSDIVRIVVAKTLVVEFESTATELTADQLYASENLINYLASLLNIPANNIKVVNVVAENGAARRRRREEQGFVTHSRSKRNTASNTIVLEIDNNNNDIQSEESTVNNDANAALTENTAFAETIIAATLNNELPAELNVLPQVAVQTVTPPVVPPCMASTVAANQDVNNANNPDYMPGEDCSIAAAYGVEPEDLATVADTSLLTTYTEAESDEQAALEASESRTQIVAPTGWSTLLSPAGDLTENSVVSPPWKFYLTDSDGNKIESAGFLDATYTATMTISDGAGIAFATDSVTAVNFDSNGNAVFDNIKFTGSGSVTLQIALTNPSNTGLAAHTVGPYTIQAAAVPAPVDLETACEFTTDTIKCVANNLDTSTDLLMTTLNGMTNEELLAIKWLTINQNAGIPASALVPIMAKLLELERLSLNSNSFWELHQDTFNYNSKLASISLHNNALQCLDGVFDSLISNNILKRIRLTQNMILNDTWNTEYRYRGNNQLTQFKALIDANPCN